MVDLSKAVQAVQPEPTPAERARQSVVKYRAQCNEDVYQSLRGIIAEESAKGAVRLGLWHYADAKAGIVEAYGAKDRYINGTVDVRINVAPLVDYAALETRLEHDGFDIKTALSDKYGTIIDTISWE